MHINVERDFTQVSTYNMIYAVMDTQRSVCDAEEDFTTKIWR